MNNLLQTVNLRARRNIAYSVNSTKVNLTTIKNKNIKECVVRCSEDIADALDRHVMSLLQGHSTRFFLN